MPLVKVTQSAKAINSLYLGPAVVRELELSPNTTYGITIPIIGDTEISGTLTKAGNLGGLSALYRTYDLAVGDDIEVKHEENSILLIPTAEHMRACEDSPDTTRTPQEAGTVFEKQALRHLYIEAFTPGSLERWQPQTETDVFLVLGVLSELTDYRYCCGTSQKLLDKLGYKSETKPDAILIDRTTNQYLMAEMKMNSSSFSVNHSKEDVDILLCWTDDESDRTRLPKIVLCLKDVTDKAIKANQISL